MNYLEKIKRLNKITLTKVCSDLNINRSNLVNGRTTKENEKRVYEKMIEEIKKIISNFD